MLQKLEFCTSSILFFYQVNTRALQRDVKIWDSKTFYGTIYSVNQHFTDREYNTYSSLIKTKVPIFWLGDLTLPLYGFAPSCRLEHLQQLTYISSLIKWYWWSPIVLWILWEMLQHDHMCIQRHYKFSCTKPEFRNLVAFENIYKI
jgi:hypothetical protein